MTGAEIFSTYLSKIGALFPCGHIRQHGFLFVTAVVWERPHLHNSELEAKRDALWSSLVEKIVGKSKEDVTVVFKDGTEMKAE